MTKERLESLLMPFGELELVETEVTEDVREGHGDEEWLNFVLRKRTGDMNGNIGSTVASFRVEGIKVSEESLEYSQLRDAGKVTCEEEVLRLKKKYMGLAEENHLPEGK